MPVQPRAQRTRGALLAAAEELFARKGYAATTAKAIAGAAGVATGSFYQYFPDKDATLHELAAKRLNSLQARLATLVAGLPSPPSPDSELADVQAALKPLVTAVLNIHQNDAGLHAVLTERRLVDTQLARMSRAVERALLSTVEGLLSQTTQLRDAPATALVLFGLLEGTVHRHVFDDFDLSDERVVTAICDAMTAIVRADASGPTSDEGQPTPPMSAQQGAGKPHQEPSS